MEITINKTSKRGKNLKRPNISNKKSTMRLGGGEMASEKTKKCS